MKLNATLVVLGAAAALASCNDKDVAPGTTGNYIVTATPAATTGVADYLLTVNSLELDSVSTKGNGIEQDGSYRYYVTTNNKFFSMLYGQGNPGAVTTYNIQTGQLNKLSSFQTETVQAFAPVDKDLLLLKISRSLTSPTSSWYKIDTDSLLIKKHGTGSVNALTLTHNGELAHFSWLKQVGTKVFAPYFCINGGRFNTAYPDSTWIAVYNYADMKLEKVIRDNRTSSIGKYFTDGLSVQENGDVYAYSPATATVGTATATGTIGSTKPSAILRIKSGTTEFDKSYLLNFETLSSGLNITNWQYLGNSLYLTRATTKTEKSAYTDGLNIGILDIANGTYKAVTGLPAKADTKSISTNNYAPKDGRTGYLGVNLTNGRSYIYKVDASTQVATRGLKVTGGTITAIQYLGQ